MKSRTIENVTVWIPGTFVSERLAVADGTSGFRVHGTAINVTTTRNRVKYLAEELMQAAPSLKGKPILKDHEAKVESIVGRVLEASFNGGAVEYDGIILDEQMSRMIQNGLINNVSIKANYKTVAQEGEGEDMIMVPRGLEFLELSLVAIPGDPDAFVASALAEAFVKGEKMIYVKEQEPPAPAPAPQMPAPAPGQDHAAQVISLLTQILDALKGGAEPEEEEKEEPEMPKDEPKPDAPESANNVKLLEENTALKKQMAELMQKSQTTVEASVEDDNFIVERLGGVVSIYAAPKKK